jgi:hypothetical protein
MLNKENLDDNEIFLTKKKLREFSERETINYQTKKKQRTEEDFPQDTEETVRKIFVLRKDYFKATKPYSIQTILSYMTMKELKALYNSQKNRKLRTNILIQIKK